MIVIFTAEEKRWLGNKMKIKEGCPAKIKSVLEKKLKLFSAEEEDWEWNSKSKSISRATKMR